MANQLLGNYELIRELGRGGMGVVYLAEDHRLNRKVAIKELVIPPGTIPDEVENLIARFRREAQSASKLQHPNIISVFDYMEDGNRFFMVMEYLEGKSLQSYIDARQPFNVEQTVNFGAQLCNALDYAHAHQIVHRDIKPDNVILLDNGKIKLMDFGVARHTGEVSKLTQAGTTLGTIAYISPEQLCDSRLVDGRSDLFSLGAMLYEMLTLRTPFDAGNVGATIMKIMGEDPVSPRQMNPGIPARLEAVIMRALRKNPDERFPRASEMGQALLNSLRAEAPTPTRPVQLNVVTCRGCGTPVPAGKSACAKCGRLATPPGAASPTGPGLAQPVGAGGAGTASPMRPMPGRPGTGSLAAPGALPPGGTGNLGGTRPGFPQRPTTSPLGRPGRPITGLRYLHSFGTPGYNPGELNQPRGLAIDGNRQLWVADTENGRVQVFDFQGQFLRELRAGNNKETFRFPRAVAISPVTNKVYVIDEQDFRIFVFDLEGRPLSIWDRRRNQSEQAVAPGRLSISPNGTIFVSEPNHRRVMVYTPAHGFTTALGAGGELQSPGGVAVGPKAGLAVLDYGLSRVQMFDQKGKGVTAFGRRGVGPGEFSVPRDLVMDRGGFFLVADTLNHRVQVFDPQGQFVAMTGQKGKAEGQFQGPEGLALSAEDQLFVSDRGNGRVSVFQVERG